MQGITHSEGVKVTSAFLAAGYIHIQATHNITKNVFNWDAEFGISAEYNFNTRTEFRKRICRTAESQ